MQNLQPYEKQALKLLVKGIKILREKKQAQTDKKGGK